MKKRGISKTVKKVLSPALIKSIVLLVPVAILIVIKAKDGKLSLEDFFAIDTFSAILVAFVCQSVADLVIKIVEKKYEDSEKLTEDHKALCKKYCSETLLSFRNEQFPIVCLAHRKEADPPYDINFSGGLDKRYQLPKQVADRSESIMRAHKYSKVYNQIALRLEDLRVEGNAVELEYSRTTYFDSLLTNRAMDYSWENGRSVREVYEPGPFLNSLKESKLSNHLGFNGFVETADGKIIFVKRGQKMSIGKGTWSNSVGASLKAKYALDDNRVFNREGLSRAIREEIRDELYIDIDQNVDLHKSIFAFYRDLAEGGKPQFLFYYKLEDVSFEQFENNFRERYSKKDNVVDGTEFKGLTREECQEAKIDGGGLMLGGEKYKMTASSAASVAMLLRFFGYGE